MKIRLERGGVTFEYERQPMKESRFRALCALAAAGVYAGMVAAITALCGDFGLLLALLGTVVVAMVVRACLKNREG